MNPEYVKHKALALQALAQMRGDDLYRAETAFYRMTEEQMHEQHGLSGKTRAEILKGYQEFDSKCLAAIAWLNSL